MSTSMNGQKPMQGGSKIPRGYKEGSIQQYTPEQMQLFSDQFQHVGPESYLSKLASGDQSTFDQIEAPALRQFNAVQGNTASRFSGMGQGGRHSSGFQNTMTQGNADFAQNLQSQRQSMQQQAIRDLMGYSNTILGQRPEEKFLVEKQQKQNPWLNAGAAAVGGAAGFALGGPAGAVTGASAGYNLASGKGGGGQNYSALNNPSGRDWTYEAANFFDPGI